MKPTPRLKAHQLGSAPQVSWIRAQGNYTQLYFNDGSQYLSAITLGKVSQRYPYLVRLNKSLAIDPALVVDWHIPAPKQLAVVLVGFKVIQSVLVARRRIRQVKQVLIQAQLDSELVLVNP
ncbi:hypothetical protein GCM10028807_01120 [Spirosoma daeguense]